MIPIQDSIQLQELTPKHQKAIAVAEAVINTGIAIKSAANRLPKNKAHRNVFIKTYNRRPMNKRKTARATFDIMMSAYMGAVHLAAIQSQPIPKYKKGTL